MKEYEVIWEIFNKCPRNQMRDVFVEEVEIADPVCETEISGEGCLLREDSTGRRNHHF